MLKFNSPLLNVATVEPKKGSVQVSLTNCVYKS